MKPFIGPDRRAKGVNVKFTERLSMFMVRVASVGAIIVLLDLNFTFRFHDQVISVGSVFSPDLKGMVIAAILIGGWTAVKEFWLGSSASGEAKSDTLNRIAEAAPAAQVAAVAAATSAPVKPPGGTTP